MMPSSAARSGPGLLCRVSPPRFDGEAPERSAARVGPRASIDTPIRPGPEHRRSRRRWLPPPMAADGLNPKPLRFGNPIPIEFFGCLHDDGSRKNIASAPNNKA